MKLILGTAQLGFEYGVANKNGQIPIAQARQIINLAKSFGIKEIDTAVAYGRSEEVLGEIGISGFNVVTKIPKVPDDVGDVYNWVINQAHCSLERLNLDKLDALLLHWPEDVIGAYSSEYIRALQQLKANGDVIKVGYSIYSPDQLDALTNVLWPDLVQTPYNVFDQRIRVSGWLDKLADQGTVIHARSVFLQGLLLMNKNKRPQYFKTWADHFSKWDDALVQIGLSPLEAAMCFVLQEGKFKGVVVGVDSEDQLRDLVNVEKCPDLSILKKLACNDLCLIEPYRWNLE